MKDMLKETIVMIDGRDENIHGAKNSVEGFDCQGILVRYGAQAQEETRPALWIFHFAENFWPCITRAAAVDLSLL